MSREREREYLVHHGIKGQKWGVRRFQNEDGSLTSEGKKRYSSGELREMSRQIGDYHKGKLEISNRRIKEIGKAGDWYDREEEKLFNNRNSISPNDYNKHFDALNKELDKRYQDADKKAEVSLKDLENSLKQKYGFDVKTASREIQRNPLRTALAQLGKDKTVSFMDKIIYGSVLVDGSLDNATTKEKIDALKTRNPWDEKPHRERQGNI